MFGINDPGIYIAYLSIFLCVSCALVYGVVKWNKED